MKKHAALTSIEIMPYSYPLSDLSKRNGRTYQTVSAVRCINNGGSIVKVQTKSYVTFR